MRVNEYDLRVLVKGKPVSEYPHRGQTFIEGRDGSAYELEFVNHSSSRVEVILSVDGLSVTDGKDAGPQSQGYLCEARNSIRIPGWKLDGENAATFNFSGKKGGSYAEQATGSAANLGVIGAMVFEQLQSSYPQGGWATLGGGYAKGGLVGRGLGMHLDSYSPTISAQSMSASSAATNVFYASNASLPPEPQLGTAFGQRTSFVTTTQNFERGDMRAVIVLQYDRAANLRKRGVVMDRKVYVPQSPQAFPAMALGCTPPAGWQG